MLFPITSPVAGLNKSEFRPPLGKANDPAALLGGQRLLPMLGSTAVAFGGAPAVTLAMFS